MAFMEDTSSARSSSSGMEAVQESKLPLADAVGPEAELLGLDLLSVGVVLVVLAAGIPPAPHGVGASEGEGSGGGLLEGGLLGAPPPPPLFAASSPPPLPRRFTFPLAALTSSAVSPSPPESPLLSRDCGCQDGMPAALRSE